MITIACFSCAHAISTIGEVSEVDILIGQRSDFWPDKYKCWACGGAMQAVLTPEVSTAVYSALFVYELSAQETYAALMGLGMPEERVVEADTVKQLFEQVGLKVKGKSYRGQHRYFLDEIEFPDGTKLHLGASPQGAAVFRITKPHSYARSNAG